jgi:hypothetical protein
VILNPINPIRIIPSMKSNLRNPRLNARPDEPFGRDFSRAGV